MKKLVLLSVIAMSGLLYTTADAQIGIHIGFRLFPHRVIAAPGPVIVQDVAYRQPEECADNADDFYYLPDLGVYYNVNEQLYYYFDGEDWIATAYLPGVYRDFDWRYARRFEIRAAHPYLNNDFYRNRYQGFDCDLAHNHDHFRNGFDLNSYRNAYHTPQRFNDPGFNHRFDDDRGSYDHRVDFREQPRFDRRDDNDRGFNRDTRDFGERAGKSDRFAQINQGYDGHR